MGDDGERGGGEERRGRDEDTKYLVRGRLIFETAGRIYILFEYRELHELGAGVGVRLCCAERPNQYVYERNQSAH